MIEKATLSSKPKPEGLRRFLRQQFQVARSKNHDRRIRIEQAKKTKPEA